MVDLESLSDGEDGRGLVSLRELTRINFRSLIGHTDEVRIAESISKTDR